MKVLGFESSCDETGVAFYDTDSGLLGHCLHSQVDMHASYGGVVPEIAARSHIEAVNGVVQQALDDAGCTWDDTV